MDERAARMCLAAVIEPGHPVLADAVADFGAEGVWAGLLGADGDLPIAERARRLRPGELAARTKAERLRFLIPGDPDWPIRLADLAGCESVNGLSGEPLGLWAAGAGDLGALTAGAVAMVGSRASTAYGDSVAADLAAELSDAGRCVVSGGAYGIDAAAHRGCLAGRTPSLCVLAGGLDQPYPAGHRALFDRIAERGVILSELPPGEHPTRVRFLARNRLIAALAPGTVLVEAAARSGARNTVTWANVLSRVVMAVPGPVTSATSVTPHRLIRGAEAVLVTGAADVLELLSPLGRASPRAPGEHRATDELTPDELRVFESVPGRGSIPTGDLAARAGLTVPRSLALLDQLVERGFLAQTPLGEWQLPPRIARRGG